MLFIRPFFESLAPQAIAITVQTEALELQHWTKNQVRFPERDVAAMAIHRQLEHFSVDSALQGMGFKVNQLQVIHDNNRKPLIRSQSQDFADQAISIAHHTEGNICHVFVAIGPNLIGCDIESERVSLKRVAHRVMSTEEGNADSLLGNLCAIWTVKESMFKALGPGLDFKTDLRVVLPNNWNPALESSWIIEGFVRNRQSFWKIWKRKSPINNSMMWMCCGPLPESLT